MKSNDVEDIIQGLRNLLDYAEENSEEISKLTKIISGDVSDEDIGDDGKDVELHPDDDVIGETTDLADIQVEQDRVIITVEEYSEPERVSVEYTDKSKLFGNSHKVKLVLPDKDVEFDIPDDALFGSEEVTLNNGVLVVEISRVSEHKEGAK